MFDFLKYILANNRENERDIRGRKNGNHGENHNAIQREFKFDERVVKKEEISMVDVLPRDANQPLRGSKRRFSENLDYNVSVIASRLRDDNLAFEEFQVGSRGKRRLIITYLKDICNSGIVDEVRNRILSIDANTILDSSYLERNIENSNKSPFPQIEYSDRPEVIESGLLQGRVGILIDENPDILLAPTTFFDLMDTPEDAFGRWFVATTFFRIARYIMFFFAACLPAFYIALTSYNIGFIPTELTFLIAASKGVSPFPIYFEAFLMMGVVEAVRLVILRIPTQLGAAIALFTGLTLVGAGLAANIFGAPIVMVVTLTIITSFGIPNFDLRSSIRIIQFFTMIMTSLFGIFGFAVAFFYIATHMVTLKSFGVPYMAPLAPVEGSGWHHTIIRKSTPDLPKDETYQTSTEEEDNMDNERETDYE